MMILKRRLGRGRRGFVAGRRGGLAAGGRTAGRFAFALFAAVMAALSVILFLFNTFHSADHRRVRETVETFYAREAEGDYGGAWELLHSDMRGRFEREAYVRARGAMYAALAGSAGGLTAFSGDPELMRRLPSAAPQAGFAFSLGKPERLSDWSAPGFPFPLADVYRMKVQQRFMSVFGALTVEQDIIAVRENGEWRLMFSYRQPDEEVAAAGKGGNNS